MEFIPDTPAPLTFTPDPVAPPAFVPDPPSAFKRDAPTITFTPDPPAEGPRRLSWGDRARELRYGVTDIPGEMWRTTRDTALSAWNDLAARPTPQSFSDVLSTQLGAGRGLLSAVGLPLAPLVGAFKSAVGHPYSAVTGIPYDEPTYGGRDAAETAFGGLTKDAGSLRAMPPRTNLIGPPVPRGGLPTNPNPPGLIVSAVQRGAQNIEKVVSAPTVSPIAADAAALIREKYGRAARDTESTKTALTSSPRDTWHSNATQRVVNEMPDPARYGFIQYVESRSQGAVNPEPRLQHLADTWRSAAQQRESKLAAMPSRAQMSFIEDYYPHMFKDPNAAATVAQEFANSGVSKQGSGASTKKRTVPTISDGIARGLEPISSNPIDNMIRYTTSMDQFIAQQQVFDTALANGTIIHAKPTAMGASGRPGIGHNGGPPMGYEPLHGRGAVDPVTGAQAYAPADWARVYNNLHSRGFHKTPEGGAIYDTIRRGSSSVTALELGLSGYHAATMAQEGMVNGVARAIDMAVAKQPRLALQALLSAGPQLLWRLPMRGKQVQNAYLGKNASPEAQNIANLLADANGRAKGFRHAADYEFSGLGSYWTAWKEGRLLHELKAGAGEALANPIVGSAKVITRNVGRILDTVAQPLFEKYIPLMKDGAFYDDMAAWLKSNPAATREQQVAMARKIWDGTDNRFGEMVADNLFWDKTLQQVAQAALRSYSWTIGGVIREYGGGMRDIARTAVKGEPWTRKASYVIALPIVYGALAAAYQFLKTGEAPQDVRDVLAPRTGGVDANSGEAERLLIPGYMKDIFGFLEHPWQEGMNKLATAPVQAINVVRNKDWRELPIRSPATPDEPWASNVPRWLKDYTAFVGKTFGPITARNLIRGQKEGSNLNVLETTVGVRTAPRQFIDPEGHELGGRARALREWQRKIKADAREENRYGGPRE